MGFFKKIGSGLKKFVKKSVSNPLGLVAPGLSKTIVGKGMRIAGSVAVGGAMAPALGGLMSKGMLGKIGGLSSKFKGIQSRFKQFGGFNFGGKNPAGVYSGGRPPIGGSANNNYSGSNSNDQATKDMPAPVKIGVAAAIGKVLGII